MIKAELANMRCSEDDLQRLDGRDHCKHMDAPLASNCYCKCSTAQARDPTLPSSLALTMAASSADGSMAPSSLQATLIRLSVPRPALQHVCWSSHIERVSRCKTLRYITMAGNCTAFLPQTVSVGQATPETASAPPIGSAHELTGAPVVNAAFK